jgi:hypothetical protein
VAGGCEGVHEIGDRFPRLLPRGHELAETLGKSGLVRRDRRLRGEQGGEEVRQGHDGLFSGDGRAAFKGMPDRGDGGKGVGEVLRRRE